MNIIFGASGHAREVAYILKEYNRISINPSFFVANSSKAEINNIPIISEEQLISMLPSFNTKSIGYIAVGDVKIRKKIAVKFEMYEGLFFENLFAVGSRMKSPRVSLGIGNLLFPGVHLTTNILIGNHNHFNLACSLSHDCIIGNYNTFSPGVRVAGGVTVGDNNFFGVNASIIDKVSIGNNVIVGAGAVVIDNITEPGTYVGIPAKRIK